MTFDGDGPREVGEDGYGVTNVDYPVAEMPLDQPILSFP
jgi:hypothetical protein